MWRMRRLKALFALAVAMAWACDWLLYARPLGWNLALFFFVMSAAVALRGGAHLNSRPAVLAGALLAGSLAALAAQPGPLVFLISCSTLCLFVIAIREGNGFDAVALLERGFILAVKGPF